MSLLAPLLRLSSRISVRLLAFNVLLVFLPVAGFLYLDTYERQLLAAQERSMVQQARVLAAALSDHGAVEAVEAERVLAALEGRVTARLQVLDAAGRVLADSSVLGLRADAGEAAEGRDLRASWLYRTGAALYRLWSRIRDSGGEAGGAAPEPTAPGPEPPRIPNPPAAPGPSLAHRPEVEAALQGRYGAATRLSPGQRSLTLASAIPVRSGGEVVGVVRVSQSTLRLLGDLYELRLNIFQVFLASLAVAVVLSLVLSTTIARPLKQLRRQAAEILDRRGRLRGRFRGSRRRDEIGDLARALEALSRRLEERIHFMESFAADVSHEFKNPLTSIRAATEVLSEVDDPGERQRFLARVETEIARLEGLLAGVREVTWIDARLDADQREPVVLNDLLAGLAEARRLATDGDGVRLALSLPAEAVTVTAVPDRLTRAFDNVLANAVSFSPLGGSVEVGLTREAGHAVVTVADRGPGIPPEHLERIFHRFFTYRPDDPDAKAHHTGLGLALARATVEARGGTIAARHRPGGGAEVEIRLPLAPPSPPSP